MIEVVVANLYGDSMFCEGFCSETSLIQHLSSCKVREHPHRIFCLLVDVIFDAYRANQVLVVAADLVNNDLAVLDVPTSDFA